MTEQRHIKALELDKVLEMLALSAPTVGAKKRALALLPSSNINTVKRRQALTANAKYMAGIKGAPSKPAKIASERKS